MNFSGANIDFVSFHNAKGLSSSQLYSTASYLANSLREIKLSNIDMAEWDFSRQDLSYADFHDSTLTNANLREANLTHAVLYSADLTNSDLRGANLTRTNLHYADLSNADMRGAVIEGARFEGTTGFSREQLYSTLSYQQNLLRDIVLSDDLTGRPV